MRYCEYFFLYYNIHYKSDKNRTFCHFCIVCLFLKVVDKHFVLFEFDDYSSMCYTQWIHTLLSLYMRVCHIYTYKYVCRKTELSSLIKYERNFMVRRWHPSPQRSSKSELFTLLFNKLLLSNDTLNQTLIHLMKIYYMYHQLHLWKYKLWISLVKDTFFMRNYIAVQL